MWHWLAVCQPHSGCETYHVLSAVPTVSRYQACLNPQGNVRVSIFCISKFLQLNLLYIPHKRSIKESSNYQDITPQRHHTTMPTDPTQPRILHTNIQDKFRAQYRTSSCRICACSPLTNAQPTRSWGHASREASQCTQQLQPLPLAEPPELWQPQLSPFCSPLKCKLQVTCKIHTCTCYTKQTESNSLKQSCHQ